jgi:phosphoribosylamine---glycine ligase
MRIGIASAFACGVGLWRRLMDEGHEVRAWRGDERDGTPHVFVSHRYVGQGIVPLEDSWHALLAWCKEEPSAILLFDSSGLGKLADEARKSGIQVIGAGTFCDRLEKDRTFGRKIAESAGIESPPHIEFSSIDDCIAYARSGKLNREVYWKTNAYISGDATHLCRNDVELVEYLMWVKTITNPNTTCVLEDKLDGFALSTARWWNGRAWVGPYAFDLERKAFMPGDVGPSTGCSLNAVGFYPDDEPIIANVLNWHELTSAFRQAHAPPGIYDINAIVDDGQAYFLEWTPRFGWDSEGISPLLYPSFSAWLNFIATGSTYSPEPDRDNFALSVRLTVAPAPWEFGERDEKGSCVGMYVRGPVGNLWGDGFVGYQLMHDPEMGLQVAAPEGLVGLVAEVGDTCSQMAEDILDRAEQIRAASRLCYRTDVGKAIQEDVQKCYDAGFDDLPSGLGN